MRNIKSPLTRALLLVCIAVLAPASFAQEINDTDEPSTARQWTESLLFAIRRDLARPTVHARNLYHLSGAMFDAWAIYEPRTQSLFTTASSAHADCKAVNKFRVEASQTDEIVNLSPTIRQQAQNRAVGMAAWTLLSHRFKDNQRSKPILEHFQQTAQAQGLDVNDINQSELIVAKILGIQVGRCIIANGMNDGANEQNNYANLDYKPINPPLSPTIPGNPRIIDPNRWQPLQLSTFIDQSGNLTDTPEFLGADWGKLKPFAMEAADKTEVTIDGTSVPVWLDPGAPPYLSSDPVSNRIYQLNHLTTVLWSANLDPFSDESIDISPGALGNLPLLDNFSDDHEFILNEYKSLVGGMIRSSRHTINPSSDSPYQANIVPLGDYTRVLAEFWADGPDSETPPGHWFAIYNEAVARHPEHKRKLAGRGNELDPLSYDIIVYLALGGALHDSAIAAWSVKRAYDYARPITAVRYMAALGQSSDPSLPSYHLQGVSLVPNRIELIEPGDALAGDNDENVGKIKAYVWLGPDFIDNPKTDTAGVGWQLLENWWPYQRPTFVTPPFAGYVSGHSTFSRAAAEVLTAATGDPYFPGGMAEFVAPKDTFLVFEQGPSVDITLQWATYRDAADQTSLSRIWGGIHPPADDLVGRKMGETIGKKSWEQVRSLITGTYPDTAPETPVVPDQTTNVFQSNTKLGGGCSVAQSSNPFLGLLLLFACLVRLFPTIAHAHIHFQRD